MQAFYLYGFGMELFGKLVPPGVAILSYLFRLVLAQRRPNGNFVMRVCSSVPRNQGPSFRAPDYTDGRGIIPKTKALKRMQCNKRKMAGFGIPRIPNNRIQGKNRSLIL